MKVLANGISMNYEIAGDGDWLVLVHGAGDNLQTWYNQVPAFSKQHRVLTYDTRGHGRTDVTEGDYTTGIWGDDLHALLNALGVRRASVVGYSLGGMIAATLATEHPEMVDALVAAGVAGAAVGLGDRQIWEQRRKTQMAILEKEGMTGIFKDRTDSTASTMFSPGFAEKHPDVIRKYGEIFPVTRAEGYRKVLESMGRRGRPVDFSKIACPVLVIVGAYDVWAGPEAGTVLQQRIPGSELVILPTGHACQIEQPEEFNKNVLSFLSKKRACSRKIKSGLSVICFFLLVKIRFSEPVEDYDDGNCGRFRGKSISFPHSYLCTSRNPPQRRILLQNAPASLAHVLQNGQKGEYRHEKRRKTPSQPFRHPPGGV